MWTSDICSQNLHISQQTPIFLSSLGKWKSCLSIDVDTFRFVFLRILGGKVRTIFASERPKRGRSDFATWDHLRVFTKIMQVTLQRCSRTQEQTSLTRPSASTPIAVYLQQSCRVTYALRCTASRTTAITGELTDHLQSHLPLFLRRCIWARC